MLAYVGDTYHHAILTRCHEAGCGNVIVRGRVRKRINWLKRHGYRLAPYLLDNGAFGDFLQGTPFAEAQFVLEVDRAIQNADEPPDIAVLPDLVARGLESLDYSLRWLNKLPSLRWFLAVQDGMAESDLDNARVWDETRIVGLFVGGSLEWKLSTGESWVNIARRRGLPCHIGRVGSMKRVRWAQYLGADSIDSSLPCWSLDKTDRFIREISNRTHWDVFRGGKEDKP